MGRKNFITENLTDEKIAEMFSEYVTTHEDEERHTTSACEEVDAFDLYCEALFPGNAMKQTELYDKMMDVAVEFEESGFIAGVKWVLDLIRRGCLIPSSEEKRQSEFSQ